MFYNEYHLSDKYYYCDSVCQTKFTFWDTVGDLRFCYSILKCILKSSVVVLMYYLDDIDSESKNSKHLESIRFILMMDNKINEILRETLGTDDNMAMTDGSLFANFNCVLVGIATKDVNADCKTQRHVKYTYCYAKILYKLNDKL